VYPHRVRKPLLFENVNSQFSNAIKSFINDDLMSASDANIDGYVNERKLFWPTKFIESLPKSFQTNEVKMFIKSLL
jgi:hypothetical protein